MNKNEVNILYLINIPFQTVALKKQSRLRQQEAVRKQPPYLSDGVPRPSTSSPVVPAVCTGAQLWIRVAH